MLEFNNKELAFLRVLIRSEHQHVTQESIFNQLVENEVLSPDEFKVIKKKLLYSGVIGVVYGNITLEKKEISDLFKNEQL